MTDEMGTNSSQLELFEKSASSSWESTSISMSDLSLMLSQSLRGSDVHNAISIAAFLACADVLAQDVSKATMRLREWAENGTSKIVAPMNHDIAGMLALEPNKRHTWTNLIEMMVYWLCFKDNAYAVIFRDIKGDPIRVVPVQTTAVAERVVYDRLGGGEIWYDVTASTQQEQQLLGDVMLKVPERDMIHIRKRMIDGFSGYGTLTAGRDTIEIMQSIEKYRNNIFAEDGQLRGVFTMAKEAPELGEPQFQRVRQQFKELMSRFRELTAPIILEGGMTFTPISSKPSDMELTKQFEAQVGQMCRLMRVPPHKIFLMDGSKYANMEAQDKSYVSDVLVPLAKAIEGQFHKKMVPDRAFRLRYFFEIDRDQMMVRDTVAERESVIKAAERGIIEIDEARAMLGKNPLLNGAGKVRLIPTNMTVVDRDNNVLIGGASTPTSDVADEPPDTSTEAPGDETSEQKSARTLRLVQ